MVASQDPSLIVPYMLLGGSTVNDNPLLTINLGITHILNMSAETRPSLGLLSNPNLVYMHIKSKDSMLYDIRDHFEEAFELIDEAREKNGRVLVHCRWGISRSGTKQSMSFLFY